MRQKLYESAAEKQKAYRQRLHGTDEVDPKIWAAAVVRAERAKRYAERFPGFIGKSDLVFQDPAWQYERELRYFKMGNVPR